MNLYDQLLELQQIPHGVEQWKGYREELTSLIIAHSKGKRVGLLGAGRCQDIDLARLCEYFEEVILMDRDERAMALGKAHYGLEKCEKIRMHVCDFIGISEEDYRHYADDLIEGLHCGRGLPIEQLADRALDQLEQLYHQAGHHQVELPECEQLVVVGIHSQLLAMLEWIWGVVLAHSGEDEGRVRYYIGQMNEQLVRKFNILLRNHPSEELVVGFELERIGRPGAVQGAYQGLDDFKSQILCGQVQLVQEQLLLWPFAKEQDIVYRMLVQVLNKKRK